MDDLPLFLQMFVRFFALLALGAGLFTAAPRHEQKRPAREKETEAKPTLVQQVRPEACPGDTPACRLPK